MAEHYVLSAEDLTLVRAKRLRTIAGFRGPAVLASTSRPPARTVGSAADGHAVFVANRVGADPKLLGDYAHRAETRREPEPWSLTSLREKLIKVGAKVVSHGRDVTFQMAEVVVSRQMFADILLLVAHLCAPPAPE